MNSIQNYVMWLLGVGALGTEIYAVVDATRYRPEVYRAADKRTKNFWLLVLLVAALVGFVLYVINGMSLEAVAGQEALIGMGIAGYALLIVTLPVDLTSTQTKSDDVEIGRSK